MPVDGASLHYRDIGEGPPVIVLHGGPDFDHNYLLPELDGLAGSLRLIYYDQRGRGRSADGVAPGDVTIESEMEDLDGIRSHIGLERAAVLGHSWGGLLAMEYATRHPERVSHLILMNTAPASYQGGLILRDHLRNGRPAHEVERMAELSSTALYQQGDIETEAEYYRLHYGITLRHPEQLDAVVPRLRSNYTEQGVLLARAIEQRLYDQTWSIPGYDLIPKLSRLDIPTLVIHGDYDFVPLELAVQIADAVPGAVLSVLPECGHFAYLEQPERVEEEVMVFLAS